MGSFDVGTGRAGFYRTSSNLLSLLELRLGLLADTDKIIKVTDKSAKVTDKRPEVADKYQPPTEKCLKPTDKFFNVL